MCVLLCRQLPRSIFTSSSFVGPDANWFWFSIIVLPKQ